MTHNVLLIDEDEILLFKAKNFFMNANFVFHIANDPNQALEICNHNHVSVVITELYMKSMNGKELLSRLKELKHVPLVIFYSYDLSFETATELIRLGAFEYVHKSEKFEKLEKVIQKTIDQYELQVLEKELQLQRDASHKSNSLDSWKEIVQKRSASYASLILENLRTAFSQGAGFGNLLSIIQRIQKKAQKEDGYYKVPGNLMEVLFENANISERMIDLLNYNSSLKVSLRPELVSIREIYSVLYDLAITKMPKYASIKNQKIVLGENTLVHSTKSVWMDKEFFIKIVEELFFNAFKFSVPNSKIFILFELIDNEFVLEMLNSPEFNQNNTLGIPDEVSELVFQPFFRLSKYTYPSYPTLDFGLGLTFVKEVINEFCGEISAKNIKSHVKETEILTAFQMKLPITKSAPLV